MRSASHEVSLAWRHSREHALSVSFSILLISPSGARLSDFHFLADSGNVNSGMSLSIRSSLDREDSYTCSVYTSDECEGACPTHKLASTSLEKLQKRTAISLCRNLLC
ncbi:uncharacterized protein LOC116210880 isoform X2 [Punica granatum]|uniref:Uncharacterized protein LOC116210880 isoform X2 n=1 Tax=Punica granatum TaxID=22663 RepID=A0A6P8DZ47_PUNGR|nr:uncharacterized protein LOC116210880 isoform X2 [Punica granatum]